MFLAIHQSYAQEKIVDTIVDGVLQTVMGKGTSPRISVGDYGRTFRGSAGAGSASQSRT
jgi:hypothetical protein